jgi:hypothetical protein
LDTSFLETIDLLLLVNLRPDLAELILQLILHCALQLALYLLLLHVKIIELNILLVVIIDILSLVVYDELVVRLEDRRRNRNLLAVLRGSKLRHLWYLGHLS